MAETQTGKKVAWATLPNTITKEGIPQNLVATEFTLTSQSELEKIKDQDGDISTHVYHGFEKTARLVAYPAHTVADTVNAANKLPDIGKTFVLTFASGEHPGNGTWEITSAEMAVTNTSHSVHTYELVQVPEA